EDLYFRLSVIPVHAPPLRERVEDIPALVQHFSAQFSRENNRRPARFSTQALEALKQARWRGNVRELKNVVERLLIMSERDVIDGADVRAVVQPGAPGSNSPSSAAATSGPRDAEPETPAESAATLREFKEVTE